MAVFALDIGQTGDHTALAVLVPEPGGLLVSHIERIPLGERYARMTFHVAEAARIYTTAGHRVVVAVDRTGVGRPIVEQLRAATSADEATTILGITWTGGRRLGGAWPDITVPRQHLIDALATVLEQRRLRVPPVLPAAGVLEAELHRYKAGHHLGDLAAAVGMAAWCANHLSATRVRLNITRIATPDLEAL
ncbi:hypothetical protein LKL35_33355 [Streptomyces sp. ET3-23]|uniref:hypothetical protein n=1 Tax=Streptomyces sp. ET3-23 TaxID=2885643 RepID=UPI001D11E1B1|nr:hypothetical protein [Streptomyces sp. ET3-23]MCC2280270.1 hypothetical protein [Streptomyces sp. ET3-23]